MVPCCLLPDWEYLVISDFWKKKCADLRIKTGSPSAIFMVLETWGTVPHTSAEKKIEIEAKSKKLSTFPSFHNSREIYMVFSWIA